MHIARLLDSLDDIRNNINSLIGISHNNNMNPRRQQQQQQQQQQRPSRNWSQSNFRNLNQNQRRPYIYYDFENPIDRATYIDTDTNTNANTTTNTNANSQDITNLLASFLNSSVTVRPSQTQINNASRLVRYSDIETPNSSSCAITLEPFGSEDMVRQLHHCGHIFFPEPFNQWFNNSVRCPVCRHDIRSFVSNSASNANPASNTNVNANSDNNDSIIDNLSSQLLNSLLNPSFSSSNDRFAYDPSNNVLLFETILRRNDT
jgi:hypothetical protein